MAFHTIPIRPQGKALALRAGQRKLYERRCPTEQEIQAWWAREPRYNVALLLRPDCRLLVLNVNQKHGFDGLGTLKRRDHRPLDDLTPTILTPHGGMAYCLKPPDREQFPYPFKTHVQVPDYPGIELRGTSGYQVVPPSIVKATSRDPGGDYRFAMPWTAAHLFAECAELPDWLLDLWIACDRQPSPTRIRPPTDLTPPQPAKTKKRVSPLTTPHNTTGTPRHTGNAPSPKGTPQKQKLLKTGASSSERACTTVLTPDGCNEKGLSFERRCGLFVMRWQDKPGVWVDNKQTFHCLLPGHAEANPSARWMWQDDGMLLYHDMHQRSGKLYWTLPEVYAALISGTVRPLKKASMKTWRLRLAVDAGLVQPYPVVMPALPPEAPPLVCKTYEGIRLVFACKWVHKAEAPTTLARAFVAGWCGIPLGSVWSVMQWLLARHILVRAGWHKGQQLYLPGAPERWTHGAPD